MSPKPLIILILIFITISCSGLQSIGVLNDRHAAYLNAELIERPPTEYQKYYRNSLEIPYDISFEATQIVPIGSPQLVFYPNPTQKLPLKSKVQITVGENLFQEPMLKILAHPNDIYPLCVRLLEQLYTITQEGYDIYFDLKGLELQIHIDQQLAFTMITLQQKDIWEIRRNQMFYTRATTDTLELEQIKLIKEQQEIINEFFKDFQMLLIRELNQS